MLFLGQRDQVAAERAAAESRALALATNDVLAAAQALILLGVTFLMREAYDDATAALEEARRLGRTLSDPRQARSIESAALANLGVVVHGQGQIELALSYHEEALAGQREVGDGWGELDSLIDLGDIARSQDDFGRAATLYREALALAWRSGKHRAIFDALEGIACTAGATGLAIQAARWFGATERARKPTGLTSTDPVDAAANERWAAAARSGLG